MRPEEHQVLPRCAAAFKGENWEQIRATSAGKEYSNLELHLWNFSDLYQGILPLALAPVGLGGS